MRLIQSVCGVSMVVNGLLQRDRGRGAVQCNGQVAVVAQKLEGLGAAGSSAVSALEDAASRLMAILAAYKLVNAYNVRD